MSWNINGSGNPVKRRKVLSYLKTNKADIVFIQETHLNEGESEKFKTGWVRHIFYSSLSSSRNGVMILVNRNIHFVLLKEVKDTEGRMICVQAMIEGIKMILCNIYAPNKGDPHFFHEVNKVLGEMDGQIILAGDFNQVMDPILDKSRFKGPLMTKDREAIHMLKEDMALVDVWRLTNPQEREYTFFSHCHRSHSRIDMFLIASPLINSVSSCNIRSIAITDHAAVELCMIAGPDMSKNTRWRMNTSLLQDKGFRTSLGKDLKSFFELNIGSTDIATVWEASKAYIRGKLIAHSALKKRENLNNIKKLESEIKLKENDLAQTFSESKYKELCKLKFQLHEIYNKKVEYSLYRLRTNFYEGGEKTGKILARQVKGKDSSSIIPAIKQGDKLVTSATDINKTFQHYYEKLYTSTVPCNDNQRERDLFFSNIDMPKLETDQAEKLESPITEGEIRKAVSLMNTGKSPGNDGFPAEYYKEYIDILAPVLVKVYQEAFEKGYVPPTFNEALISLIPKKDRDITDPANFRPISLLNVDSKILTKVLALRLQQVLPIIIHENQAGFMKNRSSTDNMRKLIHLMWLAHSKTVPIAAISLDAEKAFDKVEWGFLFSALSHFGFGPGFSQWVKILYKEPKAAVITNGVISPFFRLSRGTRQGCSLSPLLFIIFLETLAVSIRKNTGIKGIECGGQQHKLLLFADDILAVVTDPETSLPCLMETIQSYSGLSGYTINWDKSEAMPLTPLCLPYMVEKFKFKWVPKGIKYLGVKLSQDLGELPWLNFDPLLQKIKTNLEKWVKIKLTLWGKINIIKMIIAPQFNYLVMMLPITIPPAIFKKYDDVVKQFLWEGKKARIKLSKLCTPKEKGGLGLPDPRLYAISFEMAKLSKHWKPTDNSLDWIDIENEMCSPFSVKEILSQRSDIKSPVLVHSRDVWAKAHKMYKISHHVQPYASLWFNPAVYIGKVSVYWKQWHSRGICTIGDLYKNGQFMSYGELINHFKLEGKQHFWKYLQIRDCVKPKISNSLENPIMDYMNMPLERCTASQFYKSTNLLVSEECTNVKLLWQRDLETNIAQEKWLEMLAGSGKYVKEARGKFTQYKIIHRYYHTPVRLHRMKLLNDNKCWKCKTGLGTFLHCIWECTLVAPFWVEVVDFLSEWCGSAVPLTPVMCLIGDRYQLPNIPKGTFSVIMVGLITASRVILRHWKTAVSPNMREWLGAMVETASYEAMLSRLKGKEEDGMSSWELFWSYTKQTRD